MATSLRKIVSIVGVLTLLMGVVVAPVVYGHDRGAKQTGGFSGGLSGPSAAIHSNRYRPAVTAWLQRQYPHKQVTDVTITYTKTIGQFYVSQVLVKFNRHQYTGLVAVQRQRNLWDFSPARTFVANNRRLPVTMMTMSGTTNTHRSYVLVGGVVNQANISYVILHFLSGPVVRDYVAPSRTYTYVLEGSQKSVSRMDAYARSGHLIYQHP